MSTPLVLALEMIEVKAVANPKVEPKGVELGDRPDRVDIELRPDDDVILLVRFREVDVIVVLDAGRNAEAEPHWAGKEVVGDLLDRLPPRFRGRLTRERRPHRLLSPERRREAEEQEGKNQRRPVQASRRVFRIRHHVEAPRLP
jgi:hypothetical protein